MANKTTTCKACGEATVWCRDPRTNKFTMEDLEGGAHNCDEYAQWKIEAEAEMDRQKVENKTLVRSYRTKRGYL